MRKGHGRSRALKWQPVKPHFQQKLVKNECDFLRKLLKSRHHVQLLLLLLLLPHYYYFGPRESAAGPEVGQQDPFWDFPCFLILPNICLICLWHLKDLLQKDASGMKTINSTQRSARPPLDHAKLRRAIWTCTVMQRTCRSQWWVWHGSHSLGLSVVPEDMDYKRGELGEECFSLTWGLPHQETHCRSGQRGYQCSVGPLG